MKNTMKKNEAATNVISMLNLGVLEWKKTFDTEPEIKLSFEAAPYGMLALNGITLCPVSELDYANPISFDVEDLTVHTTSGKEITIGIIWPSGSAEACISFIMESKLLYAMPEHI